MGISRGNQQYVGIAEIITGTSPKVLYTVVGSCVALCILDRKKRSGGMAHIMLPSISNFGLKKPRTKFADIAVPTLFKDLNKMGCRKEEMSAIIVGGSRDPHEHRTNIRCIGERNVEAVISEIKKLDIPITGRDILGNQKRKINFNIRDGRVESRLTLNHF
jgi:chemotaxis protein CheD